MSDDSERSSGGVDHYINIEATHVLRGQVQPHERDRLTGDYETKNRRGFDQLEGYDLQHHAEIKKVFECNCGQRFRKPDTAKSHLAEVADTE